MIFSSYENKSVRDSFDTLNDSRPASRTQFDNIPLRDVFLDNGAVDSRELGDVRSVDSDSIALHKVEIAAPTTNEWKDLCSSFISRVLPQAVEQEDSVATSYVNSSGERLLADIIGSLKALAAASVDPETAVPRELQVSFQSLGSLADTVGDLYSRFDQEAALPLSSFSVPKVEQERQSLERRPISGPELTGSLRDLRERVDLIAEDWFERHPFNQAVRENFSRLVGALDQSLAKIQGRELYVFATSY